MSQQNRPTEKSVLKKHANREQASYVLDKHNALFEFVEFGSQWLCPIGDGWTITVIEKKATVFKPYYCIATLSYHRSKTLPKTLFKWHNYSVSSKNRTSAVAMLLQKATMFYNPIHKVWMNMYDLCNPHITFPRQDGKQNTLPSQLGKIPAQSRIDYAVAKLRKQR